jgi:hypothetical protein
LCFWCAAGIISCKKKKHDDSPVASPFVFPANADIPYDTTAVDGIFSANITLDTTQGNIRCNLYFNAWFTHLVSNGFTDSATIIANARTLKASKRFFTANIGEFAPTGNFDPDTSVAWQMTGVPPSDFTYHEGRGFPKCAVSLPDTLTSGSSAFTFDTVSVALADTAILKLLVPVSKDSTKEIRYSVGPHTGKFALDTAVIKSLANKNIGVVISVFNHQPATLKGMKYFFIREYSLGKNVWFK